MFVSQMFEVFWEMVKLMEQTFWYLLNILSELLQLFAEVYGKDKKEEVQLWTRELDFWLEENHKVQDWWIWKFATLLFLWSYKNVI